MSKVAHTPGPWLAEGPDHSIIVWGPEPEQRICFMTSDGPAVSNARLIASAPAMYEALERIFSYVSYVNIHGVGEQPEPNGHPQPVKVSPEEFAHTFQEIGNQARIALAKAEGRQP